MTQVSTYAYKTIEEYEEIVGLKVNEAFRVGWQMARTTNAMLGVKEEVHELKKLADKS